MRLRVMLTGADGMIGSTLKPHLKKEGFEVTAFQGECCNWKDWEKYDKGYDLLIHLAAFAGVRDSMNDPDKYFANNVGAAGNAFIWANQYVARGKILYASSSNAAEWWSNPYAMTKKANEVQAIHYNAIGMRFHTVWPGRDDMLFKMLERGEVTYINENHTRDFIHVDDLCAAITVMIDNFDKIQEDVGTIVDLGTGHSTEVKSVAKAMGYEGQYINDPTPNERMHTKADVEWLYKLGWGPKYNILSYNNSNVVHI
tara:strand:- start:1213 stop:1980 length:768 start_codon:yes stop_codon:yes gene_type:complete